MPIYQTTPFRPPTPLLIPGTPSYVWGSYNNRTGDTLGRVISLAGTGSVATVVFQVTSGNAPVTVGSLITIVGTSSSGGAYNVTNATVLTSTVDANSGIATVTFASATSQATTADNGLVSVPQVEIGETVVTGASISVNSSYSTASPDQGKVLTAVVSFPTPPTTVSGVFLQGADRDYDPEFVDISQAIASVAASVVTGGSWNSGQGTTGTIGQVNQLNYRFYRIRVAGVVGVGTIVAKLED